jgi:hypothetical protein
MHLTPDEIIDIVEGARTERDAPHLLTCEICRHDVDALRGAMSAAADVPVPEPSPLFWSHLTDRIRAAAAAESEPPSAAAISRMPRLWERSWLRATAVGVAAAVALAFYLTVPRSGTTPSSLAESTADPVGAADAIAGDALAPFGSPDDPSLSLVFDLTSEIDPIALSETNWSGHAGALEEVVTTLTEEEREELERLLREALEKTGA